MFIYIFIYIYIYHDYLFIYMSQTCYPLKTEPARTASLSKYDNTVNNKVIFNTKRA